MLGRVAHFARFALGARCQICARPLARGEEWLCADCAALLPQRMGGYCPRCGMLVADASAPPTLCLECRVSPPPWSALAFYAAYSGLLKELIHRHKFGQDHGLESLLRMLALRAVNARRLSLPDIVLPVPMRRWPALIRGFNQSVELARGVGQSLGVDFQARTLVKIRRTETQSSLGRAKRLRNVRGAFAVVMDLTGRRVLLVDDVLTTGATLTACAQACLAAGASRVDTLVLARA